MNAKRVVSAFVLLFPLIILSHPAEGAENFGICGLKIRKESKLITGCQMAQDAGLGWYRCAVRWNEVVDNDGNFNWDDLDTLLENIFSHGLEVILVFRSVHEVFAPGSGLTETWWKTVWTAAPPAQEHLPKYEAFVRQLVERYDGDGTLDAPFVNESNKISNWAVETEPGKIPDQGSGYWNGTAADYAGLYLVAYDEIKQAYPEASVHLSAFTARSMKYFINNGTSFPAEVLRILHESGGDFDVFNLHFYLEYTSYDEVHDAASAHLGLYPEFSGKPIWLTETNVEWGKLDPTYTKHQYNAFVAKDIVKRFTIMFDRGVKKVFWYQFREKGGAWQVPMENFARYSGLTRPDLTPKPVYYTYKLLTEKLNGRTAAGRIGSDPTGWVFKFGNDDNPVYVMWSDSSPGQKTQVTLSVPWEAARISHVVTRPGMTEPSVETRAVVGGSLQIDLDDSPIFVEAPLPPDIQIIRVYVTGGFGSTQRHFYVGDPVTYEMEYKISGGLPDAQYKVMGTALATYRDCSKRRKRARKATYVGPGLHTLRFQKRVPPCAEPSVQNDWQSWINLRWRIKLKTEDNISLLDRDRLFVDEAFTVHSQ
jgi:hypothetical protein